MAIVLQKAAPPCVAHDPRAAGPVRFAAEELRAYLGRILEVSIPDKTSATGPVVRVAADADDALGPDGFAVEPTDNGLAIRGGGPAGAVFGVYAFLRRFAGCRFSGYAPDGELVPRSERIEVGPLPWTEKPTLWYRGLQFSSLSTVELMIKRMDWMAKNGMNYVMIHPRPDKEGEEDAEIVDPATGEVFSGKKRAYSFAWFRDHLMDEAQKRGLRVDMNHHNLYNWLNPNVYFDEHPEWFSLMDGKRVASYQQLAICTSNREAVDTLVRNVLDFLRANPSIRIVGVIPGDGIGMCQCEACRAMDVHPDDATKPFTGHRSPDGENPSKSRRYALLLNRVADAVAEEFPDALVGAAAYVDLQWPPRDVKLRKNILPWVANYWRCAAHEIAPESCYMNRLFWQVLTQWREAHDGPLILYAYYMGMNAQRGLPYPMAERIAAEWPRLRELGIGGATVQSTERDHHVYALNYLTFARAGWQEGPVDYPTLREEFLTGMFGAAAQAIRPIYEEWDRQARRADEGNPPSFFLEPVPPARGCLIPNGRSIAFLMQDKGTDWFREQTDKARAAATTDREKRQVAAFAEGMRYWIACAQILHAAREADKAAQAGDMGCAKEIAAEAVARYKPEIEEMDRLPLQGWLRNPRVWLERKDPYMLGGLAQLSGLDAGSGE